jgi:hypothetical protein
MNYYVIHFCDVYTQQGGTSTYQNTPDVPKYPPKIVKYSQHLPYAGYVPDH